MKIKKYIGLIMLAVLLVIYGIAYIVGHNKKSGSEDALNGRYVFFDEDMDDDEDYGGEILTLYNGTYMYEEKYDDVICCEL